MAKVLAAVDLSPHARRVSERSRLVAEEIGADLTLLHVAETAPDALLGPSVTRLIRSHREEAAAEIAAWCRSRTDRPVDLIVEKGSPAWEIVRAGKRADLVVVGSSSEDVGAIGPVSGRVAEAAWGDVLVVRRQPRVPYRRVVVAVDLSEASRRALAVACRLAPAAELTVVFALPSRFDGLMVGAGMFAEEVDLSRSARLDRARGVIEGFVSGLGDGVRIVVEQGPPLEVIEEVVRRRSADLVVAASRGAGATRMVLLGTVATGLLGRSPSDVAIARVASDFRRP